MSARLGGEPVRGDGSAGAREAGRGFAVTQARESTGRMSTETLSGGIVTRAIRSHQLWVTVAYVAAMLLLVRAYA